MNLKEFCCTKKSEDSEKKCECKQNILRIASDTFAKFGLKKTTMNDIASRLNIVKSALYYYFKNKEEIFYAVIEKEMEILFKEINEAINKETSAQKKLRAYVITRMLCIKKAMNFYNIMKEEYFECYAFLLNKAKEFHDEESKIIQNILKEGVKQNEFSVNDFETTAFFIIAAMEGLEYPWIIQNENPDLEKNLDLFVNIFYKGIKKDKPC